MAQAGSSQGLRLPVSGRGQGSGIFSVGEAEASSEANTGGAVFPHPAEFFLSELFYYLVFICISRVGISFVYALINYH